MSDARLEMLELENADLRERIAFLEREMLGTDLLYPVEWCLTGSECRVVGALLLHAMCRKEMIMTTLYANMFRDEAEPKIVDVYICKIRRKLKPFGITIRTVWGVGYVIDEPKRSELLKAITPPAGPATSASSAQQTVSSSSFGSAA